MSEQTREEITQLLQRALKNVPLLKLDAVDDVLHSFTAAVELMENSLIVEDDDEHLQGSQHIPAEVEDRHVNAHGLSQARLLGLASSSNASSVDDMDVNGLPRSITNKQLAGVAITRDYSSPSAQRRSLTGKLPSQLLNSQAAPASSSSSSSSSHTNPSTPTAGAGRAQGGLGLGLGLGKGSKSGNPTNPAPTGPGTLGFNHKRSSRAMVSSSALNSALSSNANGGNFMANSTAGPDGVPVSPESGDERAVVEPDTTALSVQGNTNNFQPKNKLVAKVAGSAANREYPSPKMGARSLGGSGNGGSTSGNNSASSSPSSRLSGSNQVTLPQPDSLGRDEGAFDKTEASVALTHPTSSALSHDDINVDVQGEKTDDEHDLIRMEEKSLNPLNRVKESTLPITASPKQIRSSMHLLTLATTASTASETDLTARPKQEETSGDATEQNQTNSTPATATVSSSSMHALSALPSSVPATTNSSTSTPKPAFLRRLDSPDTHHGQLIAAKAKLQMVINRGIQVVDKIRPDQLAFIKAALEKAVNKLDSSLITSNQNSLL